MSVRKSTSGQDSLSLSRNGERTPLRSLHSENLNESLNVKSKAELFKKREVNAATCTKTNALASDKPIEHYLCQQDDTPLPGGTQSVTEELNTECTTNYCADVTLKSYDCDGGEVEISDAVFGKADDTIPLPQQGISDYPQHEQTLESSNILDSTTYCKAEEENTEHGYCRRESSTVLNPNTTEHLHKPCDITFKFLNCTGGEIEITDSMHSVNGTILLPTDQNGEYDESYRDIVDSSIFTGNCDVDHLEHPYYNNARVESACVKTQPSFHQDLNESDQATSKDEYKEDTCQFIPDPETEYSKGSNKVDKASRMSEDQSKSLAVDTDHTEEDTSRESSIKNDFVEALPPIDASPSTNVCKFENTQECDTKEKLDLDVSTSALPHHSSNNSQCKTMSGSLKEKNETHDESHSSIQPHQSDTADSALGLSPNAPVTSEPLQAETLPDVLKAITERTPLNFKFLTPIVRRASLAYMQAQKEMVSDPFVGDDCGQAEDKSVVVPYLDRAEFWREHLDSPISRPLFNSTELIHRSQPCTVTEPPKDVALPQPEVNIQPITEIPVISNGPLQQQLRQMAEFLMLASGKMGPSPVCAPTNPPAKAECHSVCVGTSPQRVVNHSINTSGEFERKTSFSMEDQCTLTDPLIWNVPVNSLESVSRLELEQRVLSNMIIVEALVQQLAAARVHTLPPSGAAPSEHRDKNIQTEHTELRQTSIHRDLYLEALNRIKELEVDDASLQNLNQYMQNVRITMSALTSDTDAVFHQIKTIEEVVREDQDSLVSNYSQMKSLLEKSRESQLRMVQKVKDVLQQKEDMHTKMEEAFSARDAAYSVTDQLRRHCSIEISKLERCVGSQEELLSALKKTNPEQVALNKSYTETLDFASELLSKTMEEQSSLSKELCTVRGLLQKCNPILRRLNEKADTALRDRDEHIAERDQALQDKEQTEEKLNQALQNLQAAKGQISDLNLQVTILTSEMGVLRQKLSESDEERAQLDRKATELSASMSSTLASYAFLEQALASETTKLVQSWADIKEAKERVQELELYLDQSEQREAQLSEALTCSEEEVAQLHSQTEAQAFQLQQLQDMCTQLSGVRDMNEFLQMENELTREQIADSERTLSANLQSLRERNIQCEDLNGELRQLQCENRNLQEELESIKTKFTASQTEHKEKVKQIVTEIVILHHNVRSVANEQHASLKEENREQPTHNSSSVTVAQITEKDEKPQEAPSGAEVQSELVFSETSAFRRIPAVTHTKSLLTEREAEEQESNVSELLVGLDSTITELINSLTSMQQQKDVQLQDSQRTICGLQRELEAAQSAHQTEVSELQFQLSRMNARMEKVNVSLQQKTQNETTMSKLVAEISVIQDMLDKHKADNNELRKEVVELRRSLQQSKSEAQFLRDELKKNDGQSLPVNHLMEEKISLLKEIERLRLSLQSEEQARKKLLERAKRHQGIYETNQQKSEKELQLLNNMLSKVRETLLSLPGPMKNCEQLQQLMEYVG